jgi:hypothetical protein
MGFTDDIRTIAKTKLITEKLDKLTKEVERAEKNSIDSKRVVSYDAGALKDTSAGPASPTPVEGATDAAGGAVTGATNNTPSIPNNTIPTTTTNNDTSGGYSGSLNTATGSGSTQGTDLSSSGSEAAVGGSKAKDQAEQGSNNSEIQALRDALADAGYTQAEIDQKVREALNFEPGVHNISDVYDGLAGPNLNFSDSSSGVYQYLKAVVGLDALDDAVTAMFRFDGQSPKPTDEDAAAVGQNPWVSADQDGGGGDDTWVIGKLVTDNGTSVSFASGNEWILYARSLHPSFTDIILEPLSGSPPNSGQWAANSVTAGGTLRTASISSCTAGVDANCPLLNPGEVTGWPLTGTYVLSKDEATFVGNILDTEVPERYQGIQSSVQLKTNSGQVLTITPAINGGTLIYDSLGLTRGLYYDSNMSLKAIVAPGDTQFYLPKR